MIKVVCYVKEYSNEGKLVDGNLLHHDICVESVNDGPPSIFMSNKKVIISVDNISYIVNGEDMITAIQNCLNNEG